jgi:hypothetical protein
MEIWQRRCQSILMEVTPGAPFVRDQPGPERYVMHAARGSELAQWTRSSPGVDLWMVSRARLPKNHKGGARSHAWG